MTAPRLLFAILLAAGTVIEAADVSSELFDAACQDAEISLLQSKAKLDRISLRAPGKAKARPTQSLLHEVCIEATNLAQVLRDSSAKVLDGLPPWKIAKDTAPPSREDIRLAFLIQVSDADKLSLVSRTFSHIYREDDVFVYLVDETLLDPARVRASLPDPLPSNVFVRSAEHAGYYYWPRVSVLLQGFQDLLDHDWDFVVHLSEADYPVHSMDWTRKSLALQRRTNFIQIKPRCTRKEHDMALSQWYWWSQKSAVATCGSKAEPQDVATVDFPMEDMEDKGFVFAESPEWVVLTREMVKYATSPALQPYRQLLSAHKAADEIFWATLALNIPGFTQTVSPQGWYMQWTAGHGHSPDTLNLAHELPIVSQRRMHFFVRKVDERESSELLQRLDALKAQADEAPGPGDLAWVQGDASRSWASNAVPCPSQKHLPALTADDMLGTPNSKVTFPAPAPAPPAVSALEPVLPKWVPDSLSGPPAMNFPSR